MARDDEIKDAIVAAMRPLDEMIVKFSAFGGDISAIKSDVSTIRVKQDGQGREIKELKAEMTGLRKDVNDMPRQWQVDIKAAVDDHKTTEREITKAVDSARERAQASASSNNPFRTTDPSTSWFSGLFRDAARPIITFVLLAAMAVGTSVAVRHCGGDEQDISRVLDTMDRMGQRLEQLNRTSGAKPENAPSSIDQQDRHATTYRHAANNQTATIPEVAPPEVAPPER